MLSLTLDPISSVNVPGGKTLIVPLTATSTSPVTYSVSSDNPQVTTQLHTGDPFLQLTLSDPGVAGIDGQTITIQLFPEIAPNNVQRLMNMVNSGFYNGLSFYRIVPGFLIQGGNQVGTGHHFDDEYAPSSIFSGKGQLAFANSGDDTNDSEFFITGTPNNPVNVAEQRALDFNFTILGQVVRGQNVVDLVSQQPASGQSATPPIIITSAQIIADTTGNTLTIFAPNGQSANITVTTNNGVDLPAMQMFTATGVADTVDDPPFLGPIGNQTTTAGKSVTFTLSGTDLEGGPMTFEAVLQGTSVSHATVSVNGSQVTVTPNGGFTGTLNLLVGVMQTGATMRGNDSILFDTEAITITVNPAPPTHGIFATGTGVGGGPLVQVYDAQTGLLRFSFNAYDPAFRGGVRVAVGDVNGDGVADIITAPGPGGGPLVNVFSGIDLSLISSFNAYDPGLRSGIFVAAGDVNGDGHANIITAPDAGGGPLVEVFNGTDALLLAFNAYDASFLGGVHVAARDVNGDGKAEIITAPGFGGGPLVKVFDAATAVLRLAFNAYDSNFIGGVYVAAGDVNGDGKADIITGANGAPHVKVFSGADNTQLDSFLAFNSSSVSGVRVAAVDANGDGKADLVLGEGPGQAPEIKIMDGVSLAVLDDFFAYDSTYLGGVFVGAGH
jgi:cyclophilin family peptidyl-prolyl cis-trans isomerase